jgi:asparagine synthetase B (glutamine-hydrolysing)
MCGFACLWKIDDEPLARRMIETISHRGPDQTRVYRTANVPAVMAHCRLSIIGPSDGSQPIFSADNILVANGESATHPPAASTYLRPSCADPQSGANDRECGARPIAPPGRPGAWA